MFAILITSAAGAAMCLAVGLVLRLSGRLGPADRHENLSLAVALALLMPLLVLAMPVSLRIDLPRRLAPRGLLEESVAHGAVDRSPAPVSAGAGPVAPASSSEVTTREQATSTRVTDATTLALGVWALGTLFFALRLARAGWIAARVRRRARPFGGARDVVVSAEVSVPMVTGFLAPSIVLPADAAGWSDEDLSLALAHERGHIARRDVPKQWAASIACAVYWFNPLAWIAARTMVSDREHAVDALVLEGGARASSYASLLVRVAARAEESALLAPFHTPAVGRADLARRVEAVLGEPRMRASRARRVTFAAAVVVAAVAAACSQGPAPSPPIAKTTPPAASGHVAAAPPRAATPSAALLERALGGGSSLDPTKQAATEETLDAWLAEDDSVLRVHAMAMELPSGLVVASGDRDATARPVRRWASSARIRRRPR